MLAKRLLDILASAAGLVALSPILAVILFLVWCQDRQSPFFRGERAARGGGSFRMVKIRSMVIDADLSGVESTGAYDRRITQLGHFIRRWKLDELTQLWNVLKGEMSLVGPRPNTLREVAKYTPAERHLLDVRPGITDMASIVFSDEGDILKDAADPDDAYDKLIRPWKSRLGLVYVRHAGLLLDLKLIWLTLVAIADKPRALRGVVRELQRLGVDPDLIAASRREAPLVPTFSV
ncbi:MAG: sugar transferase [Rhizobiaceae bacterium]|uniref:sugar transferase n=1 Tax=Parvibaculum sp. TaxID=2024848 RepID=UPI001B080E79|nr:sugar transferase [Parvibaculum sp.]MBO6633385.1 sugar transferase [Parvibaculum sp.]MBO6725854.1 sugar transferase [Rhizobiaceae bacterium]